MNYRLLVEISPQPLDIRFVLLGLFLGPHSKVLPFRCNYLVSWKAILIASLIHLIVCEMLNWLPVKVKLYFFCCIFFIVSLLIAVFNAFFNERKVFFLLSLFQFFFKTIASRKSDRLRTGVIDFVSSFAYSRSR